MRKTSRALLLTSSQTMLFYIPYFESKGIAWKSKAREQGLPTAYSSTEKWLPMKNVSLFLHEMAARCADDMPLAAGKYAAQIYIDGKDGFIGKDFELKQVLESFMSNEHLFSRQNTYWLEKAGEEWCLCNRSEMKPSFPGSVVNEWFRVALVMQFCRHWLGPDWSPSFVNVMTHESSGAKFAQLLIPRTQLSYDSPALKIGLAGVDNLQPMSNRTLKSRDISEIYLLSESYCHLPNFTLEWLASLFGVTSKTLYRYFNDHSTSFNQMKKQSILKQTRKLLEQSDDPIADIAYRMGYQDVSNFNRAIKAICGATPAQLRKQNLPD